MKLKGICGSCAIRMIHAESKLGYHDLQQRKATENVWVKSYIWSVACWRALYVICDGRNIELKPLNDLHVLLCFSKLNWCWLFACEGHGKASICSCRIAFYFSEDLICRIQRTLWRIFTFSYQSPSDSQFPYFRRHQTVGLLNFRKWLSLIVDNLFGFWPCKKI